MADEFFEQVMGFSSPAVRTRLQQPGSRQRVNDWYALARATHPDFKLPTRRFARHVGHHLTLEAFDTPSAWLPADLFLALGCLESEPTALAELDRWLLRGNRDEDVMQRAREKLLVGAHPRLEQYAGRSALKAWVGLVTKRIAIDLVREEGGDLQGAPVTLAGFAKANVELQLVERDAGQKVKVALRAALEGLNERDRKLLRGHYLEARTHAQLAAELGTSRSTVALWIEKARARLLEETRRGLKQQTQLDSGELDSLLQGVESNLDLSFSELKVD